jgi:hypothetical protein
MGVGGVDLAPDLAPLDDGDSATMACGTSHSDASALGKFKMDFGVKPQTLVSMYYQLQYLFSFVRESRARTRIDLLSSTTHAKEKDIVEATFSGS